MAPLVRWVVVGLAVSGCAQAASAEGPYRCQVGYTTWSRSDARGGGLNLTEAFVAAAAEEPSPRTFDLGPRTATAIVEVVYAPGLSKTHPEEVRPHAVRATLVVSRKAVTVRQSFLSGDAAEAEVPFGAKWRTLTVTKAVDLDADRTLRVSLSCQQQ